jgi:hypothetical protein
MRTIVILGLLIIAVGNCFAQQDSVTVDKKKADQLIRELKKKLKSKKYYLFDKHYNKRDISFSVPKKVIKDDRFDIIVKWKGQEILMFQVDSKDYHLTGNDVDLR